MDAVLGLFFAALLLILPLLFIRSQARSKAEHWGVVAGPSRPVGGDEGPYRGGEARAGRARGVPILVLLPCTIIQIVSPLLLGAPGMAVYWRFGEMVRAKVHAEGAVSAAMPTPDPYLFLAVASTLLAGLMAFRCARGLLRSEGRPFFRFAVPAIVLSLVCAAMFGLRMGAYTPGFLGHLVVYDVLALAGLSIAYAEMRRTQTLRKRT